jgi:hypothetical protein
MKEISEAERLALITHEQVRLVNMEADLLVIIPGGTPHGFVDYEDQDDRNVHHGHTRPRHTAVILPFRRPRT